MFFLLPLLHFIFFFSTYTTYEDVEKAVEDGSFDRDAFKPAMASLSSHIIIFLFLYFCYSFVFSHSEAINTLLEPVRAHFASTPELQQLKKDVEDIARENAAQRTAQLAKEKEQKEKEEQERTEETH